MDLASPILAVDSIETSPDHISAELRIGDRYERIQLGLAMPGLLAFEDMPKILDCNTLARDAVINLMTPDDQSPPRRQRELAGGSFRHRPPGERAMAAPHNARKALR